jgi:hypothetical protein
MSNDTKILLCNDVLKLNSHNHAAPLVMSSVMTVMFLVVVLWSVFSLLRVRGAFKKHYMFRQTRSIFHILIIMFCLGRAAFFCMRIVLNGFSERLILFDIYELNGTIYYSYHYVLALLFYHYASCCFYSALCILCVDWSQHLLYAYGWGVVPINNTLWTPKFLVYIANVALHCMEWLFGSIILVLSINFNQVARSRLDALIAISATYSIAHAILVVVLILFFIAWSLYAKSKILTGFPVVSSVSVKETKRTQWSMIIISFIIGVKLIWNAALFILSLIKIDFCINDYYIFVSIVDIFCDFIPLIIVALFLTPRKAKQQHTSYIDIVDPDDSDYTDSEITGIIRINSTQPQLISSPGRNRGISISSTGSTQGHTYRSLSNSIDYYLTQQGRGSIIEDQSKLIHDYFSYHTPSPHAYYHSSIDQ